MKFSDFFRNSRLRFLSIVFGILTGLPLLFFVPWQVSFLVGAATTLISSIALPIAAYREERAYQKIKDTIKEPLLFDERVSFTVKNGAIGGHLLLTDKSIILLSLEKGSHRLELTRTQVKRIVVGDEMTISIFISNTQFIQIFSGACEELSRTLFDNGWGSEV